jgi:hypothetical protein
MFCNHATGCGCRKFKDVITRRKSAGLALQRRAETFVLCNGRVLMVLFLSGTFDLAHLFLRLFYPRDISPAVAQFAHSCYLHHRSHLCCHLGQGIDSRHDARQGVGGLGEHHRAWFREVTEHPPKRCAVRARHGATNPNPVKSNPRESVVPCIRLPIAITCLRGARRGFASSAQARRSAIICDSSRYWRMRSTARWRTCTQ